MLQSHLVEDHWPTKSRQMREECADAMSIRWGELQKPLQRKPIIMHCNLASLSRFKNHRCRWPNHQSYRLFRVPLHLWKFWTLRWQTVLYIANLRSHKNKSFHRHHLLNDGIRCALENQQNGYLLSEGILCFHFCWGIIIFIIWITV